MKLLKSLVLSLLSFLLFLSLSIFGLALMLNSTLLNPDFVTSELERLDISSLAKEFNRVQTPGGEPTADIETALANTITELEPLVKEQVSIATYSIHDYLLGKSQDPNLALILKDTVLSRDFVVSVVDKLDIASLVAPYLKEPLTGNIPAEMSYLSGYLDKYLDDVITELKPWLKEQASTAADPIADYLLGERPGLSVVIPLEPVKASLRDKLWEAFQESPPPELAMIPQTMRQTYFNQFYEQFSAAIPSTFELNESALGAGLPAQITGAIAEAEKTLAQARQYISYFQLGYKALIGLMILLTLGIFLISRDVKHTTRSIGTTLLIYGVIGYATTFALDYLNLEEQLMRGIPALLQTWMTQFMGNLMAPLKTFDLALLIAGVVLIIISIVYRRRQPQPE